MLRGILLRALLKAADDEHQVVTPLVPYLFRQVQENNEKQPLTIIATSPSQKRNHDHKS